MSKNRWDNRRLWDRIEAEARFHQIDLSKFITIQEAARIMHCDEEAVYRRYLWLEGIELCGRKLVKRKRVEWLQRFRDGQLASDDQMGESLAPFDVAAARRERELEKARNQPEPYQWKGEPGRSGIEVTGKAWADWDTGEVWVPSEQAAAILGLTDGRIRQMARMGKIRRRWKDRNTGRELVAGQDNVRSQCAMYCLTDLDALACARSKIESARVRNCLTDPECSTPPPVYREFSDIDPNDSFLTVKEAADILGIGPRRVVDQVKRGRLFAWQKQPGKRGSRVYLSALQVSRYKNDPFRLQAREWQRIASERKKRGEDPPKKYNEFLEDNDLVVLTGRALKQNHGEYYSVRQAAEVLGVSRSRVRAMRERRVLTGYRRGPNAEQKFNTRRYWFFKKEDVHSLKMNRVHQKRREAYLAAKRRAMFGEDVDRPRFDPAYSRQEAGVSPQEEGKPKRKRVIRRPEHVPQWVRDAERGPVTPGEDRYIPHDPRNAVFLKTELQRWREETYAYLEELKDLESDPRINGYYPGHYFTEGHRRRDPES